MLIARSLPLFALVACSPSLEGDWDGDFQCATYTADLSIELDDEGDGEFAGELSMSIDQTSKEDGATIQYLVEGLIDLQIQVAGMGEQDLDYDAEWIGADCETFVDGALAYVTCQEIHFESAPGSTADFGDLTWDGADSIEIDEGDCDGELER